MAAGTQGTDAVNLNQLNSAVGQAKTYTDQRFNEVGQRCGPWIRVPVKASLQRLL